jgi:hypothetical protein
MKMITSFLLIATISFSVYYYYNTGFSLYTIIALFSIFPTVYLLRLLFKAI